MRTTLAAAGAIYVRNLKKLTRIPIVLFFSLFQPLLFLFLMGQTFQNVIRLPGFPYDNYLAWFAPSVVMMTVLNSSFQSGMGTVEDLESGFLDKMLTAPLPRAALLMGKVASDATRMMMQVIIIIGVSYLLGFRMTTGPVGTLLTLVVAAGFGVAWAGLSNMVALATRNSEATMMFGIMFTFPVLFMSNAMMPEFFLPEWLQTVARYNPATHVIDAVRALANTGYDWGLVGKAAGIMVLVALVTFSGAMRFFRRVTV